MIRKGLLGLNIKGCDLVCVNPTYDNAEITCMAAARVAFEFMSLIACKKRASQTTRDITLIPNDKEEMNYERSIR